MVRNVDSSSSGYPVVALYFQFESGGDNKHNKNHRMQLTDEDKQICTKVVQQYLNGKITDPVTAGRLSQI